MTHADLSGETGCRNTQDAKAACEVDCATAQYLLSLTVQAGQQALQGGLVPSVALTHAAPPGCGDVLHPRSPCVIPITVNGSASASLTVGIVVRADFAAQVLLAAQGRKLCRGC